MNTDTANVPRLLFQEGVTGAHADMICCEMFKVQSPGFVEAIERLIQHGYTPERIGDGMRAESRAKREKPNEANIANAMAIARDIQRQRKQGAKS